MAKAKRAVGQEALKALMESYPANDDPMAEPIILPDVEAGYNVDVDTRLFKTKFSPDDVGDFINFFKAYPIVQYKKFFMELFNNMMRGWLRDHPGKCLYEPFLWALKIQDKYIGSLSNNAVPDKTLLDPVCKALSLYWKDDPEYLDVLRNVILHWDWYQPAHVAMKLYEIIDGLEDEAIEKRIREYWLYLSMYTRTAFYCLLKKRKTDDNIKALMKYISQDSHQDKLGAKIIVRNTMRHDFYLYYGQNFTEDEKKVAFTYYCDSLYNCSPKARMYVFDYLFPSDQNREIENIIARYRRSHTDEERQKVTNEFRVYCVRLMAQKGSNEFADIIKGDILPPNLHTEIIDLVRQTPVSFGTQFILKAMLQASLPDYDNYIEECYKKFCVKDRISDETGFLYACAYCILDHPDLIGALTDLFYMHGIGLNARYLFFDIRTYYSQQYSQCIKSLASQCVKDVEQALKLIKNCSKAFGKNNTAYPVDFDAVCNFLVQTAITEDHRDAVRCASIVINLIEQLADMTNRTRYYSMLMQIVDTKSPRLKNERKRADGIMHNIWNN